MGGLVNFRRGEKLNEACNQKLSSLYESHKNELFSAPQKCTGKMHGPFLVCSQDEYWKSNIKISFVARVGTISFVETKRNRTHGTQMPSETPLSANVAWALPTFPYTISKTIFQMAWYQPRSSIALPLQVLQTYMNNVYKYQYKARPPETKYFFVGKAHEHT